MVLVFFVFKVVGEWLGERSRFVRVIELYFGWVLKGCIVSVLFVYIYI